MRSVLWMLLLLCLTYALASAQMTVTIGGAPPGPGTGNVSASGTPGTGQVAIWVDPTQIQGATLNANDFTCLAGICSLNYLTGPERASNKNPSAELGTSNVEYPTVGAVKTYVDSGAKVLTNTAITPRGGTARPACVLGPGSPLTLPADNLTGCDFVQIADLNGPTTFDITGTPVNGQFVTLSMYTGTARALTWTPGTNKFADEGIPLPTTTRAGGYVLYGFRYNELSQRWAFAATTQGASGGLAGTTGMIHLPMTAVNFPPTDAARLDNSETNPRLLFDNTIRQCAAWGPLIMNSDYASAPIFELQYSMTSVTGAFGIAIDVQLNAIAPGASEDVNSQLYGAVTTCTQTPVPATAGHMKQISCPLTSLDGLGAGNFLKIRLCRNVDNAVDTAAGVMEGLAARVLYTR